jgi:hypothetical protein
MTFDKATYSVRLPDTSTASNYESSAHDAGTHHVTVQTEVHGEENELMITVHGDAYVIPLYEQELRTLLPDNVTIDCDVDVGGGSETQDT